LNLELLMLLLLIATLATGIFAGAAAYVTAVEHPARVSCGPALAIEEFGPSYKRGAIMQASLAVVGAGAGLIAAWEQQDPFVLLAAVLLGSLVPFTLIVILPTNKRLLDPKLDPDTPEATRLLERWGRLHLVRTGLSLVAFVLLLISVLWKV
jgi:Domain of unknown function (DUF1772)